jgi:hypothetical protein
MSFMEARINLVGLGIVVDGVGRADYAPHPPFDPTQWSGSSIGSETGIRLSDYSGLQFDSNLLKKPSRFFLLTCGAWYLGGNLK